jgi:hypothetical protein
VYSHKFVYQEETQMANTSPNTSSNPGYKTTEFMVSVLVAIALVVLCLADKITGDAATAGIGAASAGYALSRGIAKNS